MKNKLIAILAFFNILAVSNTANAVQIMPEQFMAMVQITVVDEGITGKEVVYCLLVYCFLLSTLRWQIAEPIQ